MAFASRPPLPPDRFLAMATDPVEIASDLQFLFVFVFVGEFADRWPSSSSGSLRLSGTTDNQGNTWVLSRLMTTKFPLLIVLGELAHQLRDKHMDLALNWSPRDQNEEADALTNGDFTAFDQNLRIVTKIEDIAFKVLPELLKVSEDLYVAIQEGKRSSAAQADKNKAGRAPPKVKLRMKGPWGG